jgi:hypothetical protein
VTQAQRAPSRDALPTPETPFGDRTPRIVDGLPDLREAIAEQIYLCNAQSDMAWRALEIADDHGARYHIRRAAAHMRQVVDGANSMKTVNDPAPARTAVSS